MRLCTWCGKPYPCCGSVESAHKQLAALRRQTEDFAQLKKWADGLVIETQRLQGIEQRMSAIARKLADSAAELLAEAPATRSKAR